MECHRFHHRRGRVSNLIIFELIDIFYSVVEVVALNINLKALRILRVIRPLRTIKAAPQLKNQVTTLLTSFSEMGNAALFIMFGMLLFSILGL